MNYRDKVLKHYSNAYCYMDMYGNYHICVDKEYIGYSVVSEQNAWHNAYLKIYGI